MEQKYLDEYPPVSDGVKIRGFFRLNIVNPDGEIAGDSGWCENNVTNEGKLNFLAKLLGAIAGSSQINYAALGTGGTINVASTALPGELAEAVRNNVAAASNGSTAVRFTGTFASGDSFVTATRDISNIGLFYTNTGGTCFAANTYASSSCATNQAVNYTYDITFT